MFNKEKFHNVLAMRLGYRRILNNQIAINIEESDDILITLKTSGNDVIKFKASDNRDELNTFNLSDEMRDVIDVVRQAFVQSTNSLSIIQI